MFTSDKMYFSENQSVGYAYASTTTDQYEEIDGKASTNIIDLGAQDVSDWIYGTDKKYGHVAGGSVDIPITVWIPTVSTPSAGCSTAANDNDYVLVRLKTSDSETNAIANTGTIVYQSPRLSAYIPESNPHHLYPGYRIDMRILPAKLKRYIWLDYLFTICHSCTFTAVLGSVDRNVETEH